MNLFFYFLSFLILFSSLMIVITRVPIYSMLYLILSFVNVGILLLLLGLDFFAYIYIIIYVGAIAVLFLFTIMMVNSPDSKTQRYFSKIKENLLTSSEDNFLRGTLILFVLGCFYAFVFFVFSSDKVLLNYLHFMQLKKITKNVPLELQMSFDIHSVDVLGKYFYTVYFILFLLAGVILFIGMIGAIVITISKKKRIKRQSTREQLERKPSNSLRLKGREKEI